MDNNIENPSEVLEVMSNPSLYDFMENEENCENFTFLFSEITKLRLSDVNYQSEENRTIEDILKEAETLINQPVMVSSNHKLSSISSESTPMEIKNNILDQYDYSTNSTNSTLNNEDDTTSDPTLLNDQLDTLDSCPSSPADTISSMKSKKSSKSSGSKKSIKSTGGGGGRKENKKQVQEEEVLAVVEQQDKREIIVVSNNHDNHDDDDNDESHQQFEFDEFIKEKIMSQKFTTQSPTHSMVSSTSFCSNWEKERELENTSEKLKDTEERFQSLRLQYDSLSKAHRALRENHSQLQEETDKLKIDFQILTECTNVLRCELQSAKKDYESSLEIQKILQQELDENRVDKKKFHDITERDSKTIQDLQRQCKEMERILMRKYPDSVSALIVASNSSNFPQDASPSTRKLLEERIAQLEADAKEQDKKAQGILSSVQARFASVQAKYETHIQDLETQVLSLQQINSEIAREMAAQNSKRSGVCESTQTLDIPEREKVPCRTIGVQTTASSNPPSRAGSAQSINGSKKNSNKQLPNSHSDSSIQNKDDAHLLATLRGMRIELAIKEKAVQRLSRDLEECKKTTKKLQAERDKYLKDNKEKDVKIHPITPKKVYNPMNYTENADSVALREAMSKMKVMEGDFKALYDKRLKDLNTLQSSHEREINTCHETIRILQSRLEEQTSKALKDKRRGPIDYFALKAKVSTLEHRHLNREKSLHLLIDALSKGSTFSPEESSSPHSCHSPVNKNL